MKILYIHHAGAKAGAPMSLLFLMRQMSLRGFVCDVMNTVCQGDVVTLFESDVNKVHSKRLWYYNHSSLFFLPFNTLKGLIAHLKWLLLYPVGCVNLFRILKGDSYDVVHLNSATLLFFSWIPKILGVPIVCHIREPFNKGHFGVRRSFLRWLLKVNCDEVIAICEDNANDTHAPKEKLTLVYNSIDFDKFNIKSCISVEARLGLGVDKDAFVTLFAGGCNAYIKGLSEYLEAMALAKLKVAELVCLMPSLDVESLSARKDFENYERLKSCIVQAPFVRDIERWISASDVVYALHNTPHFSRTVMEAGAMKKPVIATDIPGITEVVDHGKTGLLCPVGDVKRIVEETLNLYESQNDRQLMGQAGYEKACEMFDAVKQAEKVVQVYSRLKKSIR